MRGAWWVTLTWAGAIQPSGVGNVHSIHVLPPPYSMWELLQLLWSLLRHVGRAVACIW
jgi:hypothetical protein